MRIKRLLLSLLFCAALLLPNALQAKCAAPAFSLTTEEPSAEPNGELKVSLLLNEELPEEIAAFQFSLHYDASKLLYKGILEGTVSDGELKTEQQGGDITGVYLDSAQDGKSIHGCLLTLSFRVLSTAASGPAGFSAQVYDITGWSEKMFVSPQSLSVQTQILPPPSNNALLDALEPSVGSLSPAFTPECFDYSLQVSEETASVLFSAQAQESEASVRVDRKNIQSGVQPTVITVTVTAPDGVTRQAYRISVSRLQNEGTSSSAASSRSRTTAGASQNSSDTGGTNSPSATFSSRPGIYTAGTVSSSAILGNDTQVEGLTEADVQPTALAANQASTRPGALVIKSSGFEAFLYGLIVALLAGIAAFLFVYRSRVKEFLLRIKKSVNKN